MEVTPGVGVISAVIRLDRFEWEGQYKDKNPKK